jgi:hypothetical protein
MAEEEEKMSDVNMEDDAVVSLMFDVMEVGCGVVEKCDGFRGATGYLFRPSYFEALSIDLMQPLLEQRNSLV